MAKKTHLPSRKAISAARVSVSVFEQSGSISGVDATSPERPVQSGGVVSGWRDDIEKRRGRRSGLVVDVVLGALLLGIVGCLVLDLMHEQVAASNLFARLLTISVPAFLWLFGPTAAGVLLKAVGKRP